MERPGGKDYESIYGSLDALENVQLCFVDTYYDIAAKCVHPGRRTERLVKKSVFKLGAPEGARGARHGNIGTVNTIPVAGSADVQRRLDEVIEPEDYVELGDGLWCSLASGYRFAVDRTYLNSLPTETAQRLYSYLAKKDYKSRFYEERVKKFLQGSGFRQPQGNGALDSYEHMSVIWSSVPRPFCCRRIAGKPAASIFKPAGIPMRELEEVVMTLDEFEAIRLADLGELYQEQAAEQMEISRPTFSRIIDSAHQKLADALVHGKALRIEGGPVQLIGRRCCRLHDEER